MVRRPTTGTGHMRIKSVRIRNFRSFDDQTVSFDPYTCFVGSNGAGKSTVLNALNVFFGEGASSTPVDALTAEDFHQKRTDAPVEITVTFHEVSPRAQEHLKDYYRNGELIVTAVAAFDEAKGKAPVQQFGERMGIPAFADFFKAYKEGGAGDIATAFDALREAYPAIPAPSGRSKDHKKEALHAFEADPANAAMLAPLRSADHFYGIAGPSKLRPFLQWVYVPAVKDATQEQAESRDGALGKLLARTVHARVNLKEDLANIERIAQEQYQALIDANQGVLDEVAQTLSRRLGEWAHPDVNLAINWNSQPVKVGAPSARVRVGEQGFEGDLARFGHGFQRSYLLALLQELAAVPGDDAPTLILGVEEPELYQHPPQARYLAQVLRQLADQDAQVLVTTHNPFFVGGHTFEAVRLFRKEHETRSTRVLSLTHDRYSERYAEASGEAALRASAIEAQLNEVLRGAVNEMFFASKIVLVEGTEDAAHLLTWITLTNRLSQFRSQGVHVIAVDGKRNLARPIIIAQELGVPCFVLFDGDRQQKTNARQITDNKQVLRALGYMEEDYFPEEVRWGTGFVQWPDDLAALVNRDLDQTLGVENLGRITESARVACGQLGSLDKNTTFIQHRLTAAHRDGGRCQTLDDVCDRILAMPLDDVE